jgi:hypothetical protein
MVTTPILTIYFHGPNSTPKIIFELSRKGKNKSDIEMLKILFFTDLKTKICTEYELE